MSIRRPTSVSVMGIRYDITYKTETPKEGDDLGSVVFEDRVINIRRGQDDVEFHSTLLHEIIHIVFHNSGMAYLINDEMEEALTRALENGLAPLVVLNCVKPRRVRSET